MQDKQRQKPQTIDGFVRYHQRRSVVSTRSQVGVQAQTGVQKHHVEHNPIGDFRPKTDSTTVGVGAMAATALPVKPTKTGRFRNRRAGLNDAEKPKRSWRRLTKRGALVVLALFVISGGWLGWKVYANMSKVFGDKNPLHVLSAFKPVPLKGQDTGHVNILLAGNSSDQGDHGGASLIDSIMLVSVNTNEHTAFMLSIPRDMWVDVPGSGYGKINTTGAVSSFDESGYPKGGVGALEKTLSENLGIAINYYSLVNYSAFKDSVNALGGIDVNIQSKDARGLYDPSFRANEGGPLKLANGVNHLNGQTALNLARARGDPYNGVYGAYGFPNSDFDRTEHQRQMMLALKDKAISMQVLSNPSKVGKLMDSVGNNVKTDFELNELASLYYLMKDVKTSNIQSLSLNDAEGKNLLANYNANGQSALIPAAGVDDYSDIKKFINKNFNSNKVSKEAATVVVLNGGQVTGLAKKHGDSLATKGMNVTQVGDAPEQITTTKIIDNSNGKKPETRKALKKQYGDHFTSDSVLAQQYSADYIIILGANEQDITGSSSGAI